MMRLMTNIALFFQALWRNSFAMGRVAIALLLLLQTSHLNISQAAFDDMGRGARAPGMADTFVAISDDANALYYNPAGLAQLRWSQLTTEYGQLLTGADDGSSLGTTYLGYVYPLKGRMGTIGLAYHNFDAANLFKERTISLSYGWKLKVEPFGWKGTWLSGFSLKQLHHQYEPDRFTENALNDAGVGSGQRDPLFANQGYSNDSYSADIGALYRFGRENRFGAGLNVMNINRPDVSLGQDGDRAPLITKLGLSYRPPWGVMALEFRRASRLASSADREVSFGSERTFKLGGTRAITLRGGYAEGSREFQLLVAGASYQFGSAAFDYAFNFPVGNLSELDGSHRLGFSFKIGTGEAGKLETDQEEDPDILASFVYDSLAAHTLLGRLIAGEFINEYQRLLLMQLIIRKTPIDDPGLVDVRKAVSKLLRDFKTDLLGWPELKAHLLVKVSGSDKLNGQDILDRFVKGDIPFALARMAIFDPVTRQEGVITALNVMGLTELAAQSFRKDDINACIQHMKQIVDIMPNDKPVMKAYRQLLLESTRRKKDRAATEAPIDDVVLPEAPGVLTGPKSTTTKQPVKTELEKAAENFGIALGYYFARKAAGASAVERRHLLNQMKALYSNKGLDLSIVDRELAALDQLPRKQPVVKPTPVRKPAPATRKPVPTPKQPAARPAPAPTTGMDPEMKKSWDFYGQAVKRGLSDHERLEILESILLRFGEEGAGEVVTELERIRKRLN